jgi:hypothetical protein
MTDSHSDLTMPNTLLGGRTIALCVTGSIAAYKAVEVARLCIKSGAHVVPVMTRSAAQFLGPVTLAGICGEAVASDMWDPAYAGEMHVAIAERADIVAIVPATADVLARLAQGRADDLVTALALCAKGRILAAPAMHPRMWDHPATQRNVAELASQGRVTLVGPVSGEVASGDVGFGRMAEPSAIFAAIVGAFAPQDLVGMRIVVTAGPTLEDLDPVRFLGNRSTGKMGFAVAERAAARGAEVTLIAGPTALSTPNAVKRVDVRGAVAMRGALKFDDFSSDHPIPEQRIFNFLCLTLGRDPEKMRAPLVDAGFVPASRAFLCPLEWAQLDHGWWRELEPHLTTAAKASTAAERHQAAANYKARFAEFVRDFPQYRAQAASGG